MSQTDLHPEAYRKAEAAKTKEVVVAAIMGSEKVTAILNELKNMDIRLQLYQKDQTRSYKVIGELESKKEAMAKKMAELQKTNETQAMRIAELEKNRDEALVGCKALEVTRETQRVLAAELASHGTALEKRNAELERDLQAAKKKYADHIKALRFLRHGDGSE